MRTLKTAREVVEALGGHAKVCKMTRSNRKASYYWTGQAGTFPSRTYVKMQEELKRRGFKASPALWSMMGYEQEAAA